MAEIVSVVQEIVVNADTSQVDALTSSVQNEAKAIEQAQAKVQNLEKLLAQTYSTDVRRRQTINQLIERQKQLIIGNTEAIGRQVVANQKLSNTVVDMSGKLQNLRFATSQLAREAPAFAYNFQTGLLALSNNIPIFIDQLKAVRAAGASTREAFVAVGASFLSITSVLSLAIPLIIQFSSKLFDSADAAKEAKDEYAEFIKVVGQSVKTSIQNTDEQLEGLRLVRAAIEGNGKASKGAFDQLKRDYPQILKNIKDENELRANPQVFTEIEKQVRAKENSNALSKAAVATLEQERTAQKQIEVLQAQLNERLKEEEVVRKRVGELRTRGGVVDKDNPLNRLLLQAEARTNLVRALLDSTQQFSDNLTTTRQKLQTDATKEALKASDLLFVEEEEKEKKKAKTRKERQVRDRKFIEKLDEFRDISPDITQPERMPELLPGVDEMVREFNKEREKAYKKEQDDIKKLKAARKDALEDAEDGVISLISVVQNLEQVQLDAIDRELNYRTQALEKFRLLAEQGNSELLQQELNRIDELQQKREDAAQKQLQLNAILQASNQAVAVSEAIGAVVAAAAKGDPYTIALRIAAAVAALVGGIASVKAAFAFKDGVVDFKGEGTGTSDSNVVRISRGESVITAAATKQYAPILEAMNAGTFTPKVFTQPSQQRNEIDLRDRLDTLIDINKQDRVVVKNSLNNHGWQQFIQRETFRAKNRYK